MISGTCKICGCTDNDCTQCIEKTGNPCYWVDDSHTLCSACDDTEMPDEEDFQSCNNCDLPDACADFGCAIKAGLTSPHDFWK